MTHAQIDERSLKFDRLVAEKLRRNPRLIDLALVNIDRWLTSCADAVRPGLIEWKELLIRYRQSPDDVINTLLGTDDHSRRLRQSSPFCGPEIISPSERLTILQQKAG